jgi:hypothetical protein
MYASSCAHFSCHKNSENTLQLAVLYPVITVTWHYKCPERSWQSAVGIRSDQAIQVLERKPKEQIIPSVSSCVFSKVALRNNSEGGSEQLHVRLQTAAKET